MALSKIDVANMLTGATPVANGGTGLSSGTTNQFLKFTGSTTIASTGAKNFEAVLTSDVSSKNNNTWYYLGYSTGFGTSESIDNGSMWDNSNGYFVAPDAGQYLFYIFNCCYGSSSHSSYDIGYCKLQKADSGSTSFSDISGYSSNPRSGNRSPDTTYITGAFKSVVSLTAGERIIFGVHAYAGGSQTNWQWAKDGTYFGGIYLGD